MAVNAKKVGLFGSAGFLIAALIIVSVAISGITLPTFIPNTGTLIIEVTDAPVDLLELEITVDSVSAHYVEEDQWIPLTLIGEGETEVSELTFDLLKLKDEIMDLSETTVLGGTYNMIKIHVSYAEATYERKGGDGEVSDVLNVPSDVLKVIVNFEVQNGEETTVLIDIDPNWAAISESDPPNFRPVLKVLKVTEEGSG